MKVNKNKNRISTWNGVDLHIHSKYSNRVKDNDVRGPEYTAEDLLKTLKEKDISIFSITDHNSINQSLYKEIKEELKKNDFENMGYVIGVELDVFDTSIHDKVFHCLMFIDVNDVEINGEIIEDHFLAKKVIDEIFNNTEESKRNTKNQYPDVAKIFGVLSKNNIEDVLLIPHYNNKDKGLKPGNALKHLNYLCFNGFEEGNNVEKIKQSLKIYLETGNDNFPFAVFSDCHDIRVYPYIRDKNSEVEPSKCNMLSNTDYPFNSIKTAFEEPRLRISIDGVEEMRNIETGDTYISQLVIDEQVIKLSPYQNTIIGKFGSGKSLIMQMIKEGQASLKEHTKYKSIYNEKSIFKLTIDKSDSDSLAEGLEKHELLKNYDFLQQEKYYYANVLNYEDVQDLFKRLNISFDFENQLKKLDLKDTISTSLSSLYDEINKSNNINNFNYGMAFTEEKFYSYQLTRKDSNSCHYEEIIEELDFGKNKLTEISNVIIHDVSLFNEKEVETLTTAVNLIERKNQLLMTINDSNFEDKVYGVLRDYNDTFINNTAKDSLNIFKEDFSNFLQSISSTHTEIEMFENSYSSNIFNDIFSKKSKFINDKLKIEYFYNIEGKEFKSLKKHCFTNVENNLSFLQEWIHRSNSNGLLRSNKPLTDIEKYIKDYVDKNNKLCDILNSKYDIFYNNESILQKSPGEKSSKFISIIFELIEKDLIENKNVILTIDQPEDNIDNDNTYNLISSRIKELKLNYNNFQIIVITHNANVGIAADSENIIIAKNIDSENKKFIYEPGSIEDRKHINEVCQILEGGVEALKSRTIKYGINVIRKVG